MSLLYQRKAAAGIRTVIAAASCAGYILMAPHCAPAQSAASMLDQHTAERVGAGFAASPVPINLKGKDPVQVGIGSYIVNGTGVCNHCHSVDQYFKAQYPETYAAQSGNPYLLHAPYGPYKGGVYQGKATFVIDHSTFIAGGQDFGAVRSKNLTPAPNGNVANPTPSTPFYGAGGIDWVTLWGVVHNGVDIDQLLTQCNQGSTTVPAGCTAAPTNAYVLQVMPWPAVRLLTDSDLNAVWQYLSSIPCNTDLTNVNGPSGSNIANTYGGGVLINTCSAAPPAVSYKRYEFANGKVVEKASP